MRPNNGDNCGTLIAVVGRNFFFKPNSLLAGLDVFGTEVCFLLCGSHDGIEPTSLAVQRDVFGSIS